MAWLRRQDWFERRAGHHRRQLPWLHAVGAGRRPAARARRDGGPGRLRRLLHVPLPGRRLRPGGHAGRDRRMVSFERGFGRFMLAIARCCAHRRVERTLPLIEAIRRRSEAGRLLRGVAGASETDDGSGPRRARSPPMPPHLMTGWADVCLDPTLSMYRRLRDAGRPVRLLVGRGTTRRGSARTCRPCSARRSGGCGRTCSATPAVWRDSRRGFGSAPSARRVSGGTWPTGRRPECPRVAVAPAGGPTGTAGGASFR